MMSQSVTLWDIFAVVIANGLVLTFLVTFLGCRILKKLDELRRKDGE